MDRTYNKPSLIQYEGILQKNRNKRPTCDQKFLEWCKSNSIRFSSYEDMGKQLGLDGTTFKKLMSNSKIILSFNPQAKMTPKLYQNKEWLFHEVVELNKKAKQIAQENGWTSRVVEKRMGVLKINNHTYQDLKKLSKEQKELITFSLLGDGCISSNNTFIVSHSVKQKDYLFWKYSILQDLCNMEPSYYKSEKKEIRGKKSVSAPSYRFNTKKINELEDIRKTSLNEIVESLNNYGLSIWFLDDGYRGSCWELCLANYTETEKSLILKQFQQKGLSSAHLKNYDSRYVRFSTEDSRKIDKIILNEIPNNLDIIKYKILENDKIKLERNY